MSEQDYTPTMDEVVDFIGAYWMIREFNLNDRAITADAARQRAREWLEGQRGPWEYGVRSVFDGSEEIHDLYVTESREKAIESALDQQKYEDVLVAEQDHLTYEVVRRHKAGKWEVDA